MTATLTHWINGAAVPGASSRFGEVYDPSAGEVVAHVPFANSDEVENAVQAASEAAPGWARTPPIQRARVIFAFKELVERRKEDLSRVITREHGKVLSDAMGSVSRGIEVLEFACGIPHLLRGDFTQSVGTGVDSFSS
ncbi:MAG: aldehyde dehydrogenase family protein, partial [Rhodospirillaceae bacterium]|nr:aldehyde dehydrogenase family protein [Rhodospirillaceae bacterium]